MNNSGFKIHYFRDIRGYRILDVDKSIPLDLQEKCPACGVALKVFCILRGRSENISIRIGCCEDCGYVGYIDRPTEEWMTNFYKKEWDKEGRLRLDDEFKRKKHRLAGSQIKIAKLVRRLSLDFKRPLCDIGCGRGDMLRELEFIGFKNLIGVENSGHRGEVVRRRYGYKVFTGSFESENIFENLRHHAPIALFTLNHVLEHVYHPAKILKKMSVLQNYDDYLILAMPNARKEPRAIIVFWLPHLHSFTEIALEKLLNASGYEIVDDTLSSNEELVIVCRKIQNPRMRYKPEVTYFSKTLSGFTSYFRLAELEEEKRYIFSWMKAKTPEGYKQVTLLTPTFRFYILDKFRQWFELWKERFLRKLFRMKLPEKKRSFVMSSLRRRFVTPEESFLEIQFAEDIQLIIK